MKKDWKKYTGICFSVLLILAFEAGNGSAQKNETVFKSVLTPVYRSAEKTCQDTEFYVSEGDYFAKLCPGLGKYRLLIYRNYAKVNYGVSTPTGDFSFLFTALETSEASEFDNADLYQQRLVGQIEWRTANGVPFAAIVRVEFYKNKGAKTFKNPKNKAGEFVFVRGLKGFEKLRLDLDAVHTPYNLTVQSHLLADEFYEQKKTK